MKKIFTLLLALMTVVAVGAREGVRVPAGTLRSFGNTKVVKRAHKAPRKAAPLMTATQTFDVDMAYITDYGEMGDGTFDYYVTLCNSKTTYPAMQFDIYVTNPDDFSGKYSVDAGNLDVEYGYIMFSEDEDDYDFMDDCEVTVTKVGNKYKIEGAAVGYYSEDTYKFSLQSEVEVTSAYTYDYEPDEVTTINFVAGKCELEDMTEDYGVVYLTMTKDNYTLELEYNADELSGGKIPAGTYNIDASAEAGTFSKSVGGDDYYDYGCYLMVEDGDYYDPYYLVSGTVTIGYDENGLMSVAVDAKSAKGSTIKVTYEEKEKPTPQPGEGIEIVMEDYQSASFTSDEGIEITTEGGNNPAVYNTNSKDLRVYATGNLTIEAGGLTITQIVFDLSAQGLKRQAEITPSTGTMTYDIENAQVIWTGSATSVTFTVGDKAKYGSESTKAGQFDFVKVTITTAGSDDEGGEGDDEGGEGDDGGDDEGGDDEGGDTPTPSGDSLIANGSFENWNNDVQPTGWEGWQMSEYANTSSASLEKTTDAYDGNYACIVRGGTSNLRLATSPLTLPAGTYTVRFYAKAVSGTAAVKPGYATMQSNGSAEYNYGEFANEAVDLNGKWMEIVYEFNLNKTTQLSMVVMNYKNPGADFIVDAYELKAGGISGINEIVSETTANGVMYNLAGQKVGNGYKGIAIINGKKVLLK